MTRLLTLRGWAITTAALLALHLWGRHELKQTRSTR